MQAKASERIELVTCVVFTAGLLVLLELKLLPALLAGLLVYGLVHALVPLLRTPSLDHQRTRIVAVALIAVVVIALILLCGFWIGSFFSHSGESVPLLLQRMAEIIENSRARLPPWIVEYIPEDTEGVRNALVGWLKDHAQTFQVAGTGLGRGLAHVLVGMVIGGLLSLEVNIARPGTAPLASIVADRGAHLDQAFRRVVFAQFWISAINTALTALFLAGVLPLIGVHLPFTKTLVLITFVAGLIPILGNLISNTVIFIVGLSQSLFVALGLLLYLVLIHKLEYFLNARIVGSQIRSRAWELLLAMLVMEAGFGIPGLIAAPIYYSYVKEELRGRGLL